MTSVAFLITTVDPRRADQVRDFLARAAEESEAEHVRTRALVMSAYGLEPRWDFKDVAVVNMGADVPYVEGLNDGMRRLLAIGSEDLLVKMDDDIVADQGPFLRELVAGHSRHPNAILGAKLLRPNGAVQHAGGVQLRAWGRTFGAHYGDVLEIDTPMVDLERPCEFVTGAFFGIPRKLWRALGPFDVEPGAWEDSSYCFRAREARYEVWYLPKVVLTHGTGQEERARDPEAAKAYDAKMRKAEAWFRERFAAMLYPKPRPIVFDGERGP